MYFGTYLIDTLNHQIKHCIQGAINPKDIGKELIRNYSISGDTLVLWFNTFSANVKVTRTVTWVKESTDSTISWNSNPYNLFKSQ
jgi:Lipocalin-like domain